MGKGMAKLANTWLPEDLLQEYRAFVQNAHGNSRPVRANEDFDYAWPYCIHSKEPCSFSKEPSIRIGICTSIARVRKFVYIFVYVRIRKSPLFVCVFVYVQVLHVCGNNIKTWAIRGREKR